MCSKVVSGGKNSLAEGWMDSKTSKGLVTQGALRHSRHRDIKAVDTQQEGRTEEDLWTPDDLHVEKEKWR